MEIDITNIKGLQLGELFKQYSDKDVAIKMLGEKVIMVVRE